jgi:hypothetical protein
MTSSNNTPRPLVVLGKDNARRWSGVAVPRLPAFLRRDERGEYLSVFCVCGCHIDLAPDCGSAAENEAEWQQVIKSIGCDNAHQPKPCDACGANYVPVIMGYADDPAWHRRPELYGPDGNWRPHVRAAMAASFDAAFALPSADPDQG